MNRVNNDSPETLYRNFILINLTLLLSFSHLFIHVCFSTIMLAQAKTRKSMYIYISVLLLFFFSHYIYTSKKFGQAKKNHLALNALSFHTFIIAPQHGLMLHVLD